MSYIFSLNDLNDLVYILNAETKRNGDELQFKYCPYCHGNGKDKWTFSVNTNTGVFNCFRASCGKQGHFVELARDFNFRLPFEKKDNFKKLPQKRLTSASEAIQYLANRGITETTVKKYEITTQKENKKVLVFPFRDEKGELQCIKYRNTNFNGKGNKEWFEKGTKPILFGMHQCKGFDRLIITEGQIDALSVAQCGFDNVVSVPNGANGFTWVSFCYDWISRFKEILIFGDNENGKITLVDTLSLKLKNKILIVRSEDYLGEKDANDILCKYGETAIIKCINNAKSKELKQVERIAEAKPIKMTDIETIRTGIKELDKVLGGLFYSTVTLLTGKRGEGKSTFLSQLVANIIEQNKNVFVYSGELTASQMQLVLDFQLAGANNIVEKTNRYNETVFEVNPQVIEKIHKWYFNKAYKYDNNYIPISKNSCTELLETIEQAIMQYDVKAIFIDNLMTALSTIGNNENLYSAQSNFVGKLKGIATKYNVVIVLVAHPRKTIGEVGADDISGTGDIANKVDNIIGFAKDEQDKYANLISITKNRFLGTCLTGDERIRVIYDRKSRRITDMGTPPYKYGWEKEIDEDLFI